VTLGPPSYARLLPLATGAALLAVSLLPGSGAAATPGCPSFRSQAAAQEYLAELGGGPGRPVGALDDDRDGVACEELPGPYKAFATIGYNRRGGFFYGIASMPSAAQGEEGFPCLYGNRHFPDGPRRLNVYKVRPGADRPIFAPLGAEARPESGRLLWKAERDVIMPGLYYAAFEEKVPMSPYGANQCPGFRSREVALP
jgi:hypothetical protein